MQERFASIISACTDERGNVDKTKLLELLRLSPDDPVTLVVDVLIANIDVSGKIISSGGHLLAETEKLAANQAKQSNKFLIGLGTFSGKLEGILEKNSQKVLMVLDEMRTVSQELKQEANERAIACRSFNKKSAILYFSFGFLSAVVLMYFFFEGS